MADLPDESGAGSVAPGTAGPAGEDRILTIPNAFTTIRLLCVPAFVVLLSRPHRADWFAAAVLLAVLGATDWVDGQLARRLHQVSTVGKVLDPVADRVLLAVAAIGIVAVGAVPAWVAVAALLREAVVAAGTVGVALAGGRRMDVQLIGKAATFALMFALPLFLAGHSHVGWHRGAEDLAWVFVVPALVLGWTSVVTYVPIARRSLAEGRSPREATRQ
jgi:cardiolipin synthase